MIYGETQGAARLAAGAFVALLGAAVVLQLGLADAETVEAPAVVSREAYFTYPITQTTPPVAAQRVPAGDRLPRGRPRRCAAAVRQRSPASRRPARADRRPPDPDHARRRPRPTHRAAGHDTGRHVRRPAALRVAGRAEPAAAARRASATASSNSSCIRDGFNFAIESPALRDIVLQTRRPARRPGPGEDQRRDHARAHRRGAARHRDDHRHRGVPDHSAVERRPRTGRVARRLAPARRRLPHRHHRHLRRDAGTWVFDLTFAAQAWTEGVDGEVLANQGIMLRPLGAPNFAYGDPDFSTNWVVSLADSTATDAEPAPAGSIHDGVRRRPARSSTPAAPSTCRRSCRRRNSARPRPGRFSVSRRRRQRDRRCRVPVVTHRQAAAARRPAGCGWRCRSGSSAPSCSTSRSAQLPRPCAAGPAPSPDWRPHVRRTERRACPVPRCCVRCSR